MYHFIGIKGAGMSALAIILKQLGYQVQGSDIGKVFFTDIGLNENNIKTFSYNASNIKENQIIIKGASITEENVEYQKALELGLKIYEYNEFVGELTRKHKTICVAGCHGKTTTTAMLSLVLKDTLGLNYLIGDGTGYANKDNQYFALESCEYRRHFLEYSPYYAIITNIDLDHVDYYKDINDIIDAYSSYANKASKMVIMWGEDLYSRNMKLEKPTFFYGLKDNNDLYAYDISYSENGTNFKVMAKNNHYGEFNLPIYGEHQLLDALAVLSVCYLEGLSSQVVEEKFKEFKGAKRRFTETKVAHSIIIDDYAHHPNEVKATIMAVSQKYPGKKIVTIFQPHTFTRTSEFANDLVEVFKDVDKAYILDIHPAREKQEDYPTVTSNLIIDKLDNCEHINLDEEDKLLTNGDAVYVFMSPNDISKLENNLISKLNNL